MKTEVPFSLLESTVKVTSHFLVRDGEKYIPNEDPTIVKVIGQFTILKNSINPLLRKVRKRFESSTIAKTALTEEMIAYYKKTWTEEITKKLKEKSHVS